MDMEILRKRLREAFGSDSQDTIGAKLNMTQGNVSKLLSGSQQPTLETVYAISKTYDVSVDWLLGISDVKQIQKRDKQTTYSTAIKVVMAILENGGEIESVDETGVTIRSRDMLFSTLLSKASQISKIDHELYRRWVATKLSLFDEKPILERMPWNSGFIYPHALKMTELEWLTTYEKEADKIPVEFLDDEELPYD